MEELFEDRENFGRISLDGTVIHHWLNELLVNILRWYNEGSELETQLIDPNSQVQKIRWVLFYF